MPLHSAASSDLRVVTALACNLLREGGVLRPSHDAGREIMNTVLELSARTPPAAAAADEPPTPAIGPRIYYVSPLLAGPLRHWPALLDHVADLGFDHVLIAPPFLPGRTGDLFLPA